jgi:hypothetical protein
MVDFISWMALVELVHPQGSHQVSVVPLIKKCDLFKNNPGLAIAPSRVESRVSLEDFRDCIAALEDKPINIKDRNFPGLSQLSEEFGFQALSMKLSAHRRSPRLADAQTAELQSRFQRWKSAPVSTSDRWRVRLASELEAFRDSAISDTARPTATAPPRDVGCDSDQPD